MTGLPRRHLVPATALLAAGLLAAPAAADHKDGHGKPEDKPAHGSEPNGPAAGSNGNPGTIKIAAIGEDTHEDNNPKPGCPLRVDFYGFNTGTYALRINAHAPTGDGQLLASDSVAITQPRDGGPEKFQTSRTYDLRAALSGVAPAKQGYHVKVTVTNPSKPGNGGKHKVAWLDCVIADTPTSSAAPRRTTARPASQAAVLGAERADAADVGAPRAIAGAGEPQVLGVKITRPAAGAEVAPASAAAAPGTLPFTGSPLGLLFWIAAATTLWGVFLTGVARVHRSTVT